MKTGGHIKPCKVGSVEEHNERDQAYVERMKTSKHPLYFYPELALRPNQNWKDIEREEYRDKTTRKPLKVAQVFNRMIEVYTEHDKRHRRPPLKETERFDPKTGKMKTVAGWSPIREMVVVIKPDTKLQDFDKVKAWFAENGVGTMFLSLHFDEGHLDEQGNLKANNHAHMGLDFFNWETGKTVKLGPAKMKELQTVLADALGMERGEIKELTGKEHLDVVDQRIHAKMQEEKEIDKRIEGKQQLLDELDEKVSTKEMVTAAKEKALGIFGQSSKDKTIKQLQATIAGEPQRIDAAKADEREQTIRDICKAARYKPNDQTVESIGKSWRKGWDKVDSLKEAIDTQNSKILEQEREIKRLNNKISLMDKIEKAMQECCDWAAKCARGKSVWQWVYEKFEALCDAKGINQEWKNGRHSVAADVWLATVDPDNYGKAYGQFTEEQQNKLSDELHKAADHPELGLGKGLHR
jgi:hypothetical protein